MDRVANSIERYHEKVAGNFLGDWIKKHIPLPSKEKALKVLKKNIKTEEDLNKVYESMPKIISFLKSKKAMWDYGPNESDNHDPVFPSGFVKNLAILIAMMSVLGNLLPREIASDKLKEHKVIYVNESGEEVTRVDKYLGDVTIDKRTRQGLNPNSSIEAMNKVLLDHIVNMEIKNLNGPSISKIHKVKYPLELKFTTDKAGRQTLYPSQINKLKDGDKIYVHRDRTPEEVERVEKNLKDLENERKTKNEKI